MSVFVPNPGFWNGRRVFVTGHTGFKGGWLTLWLQQLGAQVTGFALAPATRPNLYTAAHLDRGVHSVIGDVRDVRALHRALAQSTAEVVVHCAAQSLVRASYASPAATFETNVMGTVHVLDAIRRVGGVRAAVIVTSDKCYEPTGRERAYRERDRLGGKDPYSSSKACAELVTSAYRESFFNDRSAAAVATVRAGNVIGGGDWAADRLVPDLIRACTAGHPAFIRYPEAVRPWQHVLEPLQGYLLLAEALHASGSAAASWNFGPSDEDMKPVSAVVDMLIRKWGNGAHWAVDAGPHPPETPTLRLDSSRARAELAWRPRFNLDTALDWTVEWYKAFADTPDRARQTTVEQIDRYQTMVS